MPEIKQKNSMSRSVKKVCSNCIFSAVHTLISEYSTSKIFDHYMWPSLTKGTYIFRPIKIILLLHNPSLKFSVDYKISITYVEIHGDCTDIFRIVIIYLEMEIQVIN